MENFEVLSSKQEKTLSEEQLIEYYNQLREYLSFCNFDHYGDKGILIREKLNILIKKILKRILKYEVYVDGYENIPSSPVIYASSHQDFNDITNSIFAYPEHFITLNAVNIKLPLKILLELNGVIWIDRTDKQSRTDAKIEMEKAIAKGKSINLYPEATWNCTPSKLHLPFYIGMIDMARRMGVPVIPVVQEYTYDESKMDGKSHVKSVHIRFGKPVYVKPEDDLIEKLCEFDENFSTVRWQLIEEKGMFNRTDISNQLYANYIRSRIRDWRIPGNDIVEERSAVYGHEDDFYLFYPVNDVEFDENYEWKPTEYVRQLSLINKKHNI